MGHILEERTKVDTLGLENMILRLSNYMIPSLIRVSPVQLRS